MKLLLTSGGLMNEKITDALYEMAGKRPEELTIAFIPTAANVEQGDKWWLVKDLMDIREQHFKEIFIVDISAVSESIWRPQLEAADVLFFEGGNTYYLMRWVKESGLAKLLPELLETKVYVGVSAGSMITGPVLDVLLDKTIYGEDAENAGQESVPGLGLVNFCVMPHLNSPYFPVCIEENARKAAELVKGKFYVLDDQSALKVVDGVMEKVGTGTILEFN